MFNTSRLRISAKWAASLSLLCCLAGCNSLEQAFEPLNLSAQLGLGNSIELRTLPIALMPANPQSEQVGQLHYRGGLYLRSDDYRFGGFSGLAINNAGQLLAVSDEGYWLSAEVVTQDGRLSGLKNAKLAPLLDEFGLPAAERRGAPKAITPADPAKPEGPLLISFERDHRAWLYPFAAGGLAGRPRSMDLPAPARARNPQCLLGLDGQSVLVLSEDQRDGRGNALGWLVDMTVGSKMDAYSIALEASGDFRPADLAALAGGDIFVLERSFALNKGSSMQIRRIRRASVKPGAILRGEILARLDVHYSIDNMEGLAVRRSANGETVLYVVSNDHFSGLQRSVLLSFAIADGAGEQSRR